MMKYASTLILALLTCMICEGSNDRRKEAENMIAVDLGAIMTEDCIRFSIGHTISDRWSASTTAMIGIGGCKSDRTDEEMSHDNEFSGTGTPSEVCFWSGFALHHWLQKPYEGAFIMIGCKCKEYIDADCRLGFGYHMPVGCGIKVSVSFEADLIASSIGKEMTGNGLTIELCYTF